MLYNSTVFIKLCSLSLSLSRRNGLLCVHVPNQIFRSGVSVTRSFHASNPSQRVAGSVRHRDAVSTRASSLLHVKVRLGCHGLTQQIGFPILSLPLFALRNVVIGEILGGRGAEIGELEL